MKIIIEIRRGPLRWSKEVDIADGALEAIIPVDYEAIEFPEAPKAPKEPKIRITVSAKNYTPELTENTPIAGKLGVWFFPEVRDMFRRNFAKAKSIKSVDVPEEGISFDLPYPPLRRCYFFRFTFPDGRYAERDPYFFDRNGKPIATWHLSFLYIR